MAKVKVPPNVSSITLTTSGALTPAADGVITCTADEATSLTNQWNFGPNGMLGLVSTAGNGDTTFQVPPVVTAITIAGTAYTVTSRKISPVPAADAAAYIQGILQVTGEYLLVTG